MNAMGLKLKDMSGLNTVSYGGPFPARRLSRRLFWAHPRLYRWLGILRGRGDCAEKGFDLWVGGYPRSANSFVTAALRLANPEVRVATHWHIPTFIINAVRKHKPGIFLVREPTDAALSWAIFWEGRRTIEYTLEYYLDFHRALLPYRDELFIASFDEATGHFEQLLRRFNSRFGTAYISLAVDQSSLNRCVTCVEDWFRAPDGSVNEFTVPRPSPMRAELKAKLFQELRSSPGLLRKLAVANDLYKSFSSTQNSVPLLEEA